MDPLKMLSDKLHYLIYASDFNQGHGIKPVTNHYMCQCFVLTIKSMAIPKSHILALCVGWGRTKMHHIR